MNLLEVYVNVRGVDFWILERFCYVIMLLIGKFICFEGSGEMWFLCILRVLIYIFSM